MVQEIDLGLTCDMHVHVREGAMCELVTPKIRDGGVSIAYIMPNLQPPITTLDRVIEYKKTLQKLAPKTTFLMSFYLSKDLTPDLIHEAAQQHAIRGVKCYPAGVTTNSAAGVDPNDFSAFYPIFKAMQEENLVLNLHGEKPSVHDGDKEPIHVLNAEEAFLPALKKLHNDFPNLKIILEHCTSESAIRTIEDINKNVKKATDVKVAATLTAHHLFLTIDDWAGNPVNFCKPVAKLPNDKRALVKAAVSGKPYFFFGSDSAPHPVQNKAKYEGVCAGVYSQSFAIPYIAQVFEEQNALENLKGFVSDFGISFYEVKDSEVASSDKAILFKKEQVIPQVISDGKDISIIPFKAGDKLSWSVRWEPR
ncbi:Ura4p [Saccharomyces cerevisiae YJM326]|nr:Ura4p [Saccharomyces cerevisiae YJM1383]AJV75419.1 Ura4p [Saccharomyces cerevisiae YJM320]AJV75872.1 Ura4p [Saccharomyces cerevisiae YJM326]AJV79023.1 Ura4p [Saccharomyces cerevisiae YJM541]AJV79473.1 Ura4p [Saccharomyces cerevisiae YJM554]AJV81257.1 Ura4p [Saccharomyces cerevisiae YJM682]AJV81711.1 Ura4p [Saccharomyces cerevisiae YJM683]AJV82612.1 Ura4p [Saccharomyces cerevisiae YJM693]CAI4668687.1 ABA_G0039370.mRNA.1.CDS.1 [Saccharomyces cerevisiae]